MVVRAAQSWATLISSMTRQAEGSMTILGPVPAPRSQLRGRHRMQILLKSRDWTEGIGIARETLRRMEQTTRRRAVKFDADVDPIDMG